MKVIANAQRSDGWWAIDVPSLPGLFTQARRLDQVEALVKDAGKMLGKTIDSVEVRPLLSSEDELILQELSQARQQAEESQKKASTLTRSFVHRVRSSGMTVRDTAQLLGVSPQRISALQH